MAVIFCDSWDHYSDIGSKWTVGDPNTSIDLTGTKSRTGIGCMLCTAASGARLNLVPTQKLILGTAYYSNGVYDQNVFYIQDTASSPFNTYPVRVIVTGLGAIQIRTGNDPVSTFVCTSAPGVFHFSEYNYIEVKVDGDSGGSNGTVAVQCNGVLVASASNVTWTFGVGHTEFGMVLLSCAGGLPDCRHDDTYIIDWTNGAGANIDFLGPVQIYAGVPVADTSVTWTPSTGVDNFANVDEIPPNGDTDYNFTSGVGDVDQYEHPLTAVPANSTIFAVQHCQALRVDSGSLTLTSVVETFDNIASVTITSGSTYLIFHWDYDLNPATGVAWQVADFPVDAGPKLVA